MIKNSCMIVEDRSVSICTLKRLNNRHDVTNGWRWYNLDRMSEASTRRVLMLNFVEGAETHLIAWGRPVKYSAVTTFPS